MEVNKQRHIIKKQIIELNLSSEQGAFELQNEISRIYKYKIIPLIDNLLSQFGDTETIHRINTLEIDLGDININNLEQELIDKILEKIQQQLAKKVDLSSVTYSTQLQGNIKQAEASINTEITEIFSDEIDENNPKNIDTNKFNSVDETSDKKSSVKIEISEIVSKRASQLEIISYFIKTGILPWWAKKLSKQELEQYCDLLITTSPNKIKYIVEQSLKNEKQLQRIIYQFSDSTLLKIAGLFTEDLVQFIADYHLDIKSIFEDLEATQSIPETKLRLQEWQGILLSFSLDSNTKIDKFRFIQSHLLHITSSNKINYSELLNNIITKTKYLIREGKEFRSSLPDIVMRLKKKQYNTQFFKEKAKINLLLSKLQKLNLNTRISPKYKQQINQLENEIKILHNELNNYSLEPNKLASITRVNQLEKIVQTLTIEIEQKLNSNQIIVPSDINNFSNSDEIYISNAGLILLWPFLTHFFLRLGLTKENVFIDIVSTQRAILLLEYLVDASTEIPENILPLNKILCGLDLLEPINTKLKITEQEQSECKNLLSATLQNWSILKNTSREGFRNAFLQRNGILRVRDSSWLLQVERKTYDILLDRIPWSIRVIKLPWMEYILYVEW